MKGQGPGHSDVPASSARQSGTLSTHRRDGFIVGLAVFFLLISVPGTAYAFWLARQQEYLPGALVAVLSAPWLLIALHLLSFRQEIDIDTLRRRLVKRRRFFWFWSVTQMLQLLGDEAVLVRKRTHAKRRGYGRAPSVSVHFSVVVDSRKGAFPLLEYAAAEQARHLAGQVAEAFSLPLRDSALVEQPSRDLTTQPLRIKILVLIVGLLLVVPVILRVAGFL